MVRKNGSIQQRLSEREFDQLIYFSFQYQCKDLWVLQKIERKTFSLENIKCVPLISIRKREFQNYLLNGSIGWKKLGMQFKKSEF
ncbi:hypothetical protein FGO68_gene13369 [Halteria grandinella]|uniref:Uncharacterized protein n=1 Tax=Halteria grandinella TaxID=5974 RepID=A0A8J8NHE6_HALGN|nr:hypothetical protein FGO68_gene13369 [Halteria grandinella]